MEWRGGGRGYQAEDKGEDGRDDGEEESDKWKSAGNGSGASGASSTGDDDPLTRGTDRKLNAEEDDGG